MSSLWQLVLTIWFQNQFVERIDFIASSPGLYFSNVATVDEPVTPAAGFNSPRFASDHKFVRARVHVPFQ